jgi:hypothetical protein
MTEGPLVSVQHRSTTARTLATRTRDSYAAARHLTATLPPERRPGVSVEAGLISTPLELGEAIRHFPTSPDAASLCFVSVERTTSVSSSIRRFLSQFPAAAAPFHRSYLSSCAGSPGEARNRHPTASLSAPTTVIGESFTPCDFVQSQPLAAMPHPSGRFPSVPEAREALYPVEPPRRR